MAKGAKAGSGAASGAGAGEATAQADLGFAWRIHGNGDVEITRAGRLVTVLRGEAAHAARVRLTRLDPAGQQQWMARLTGHYRQGNERAARAHHRNR